ncbi:putative RNA-binding protein involved in heterochromatin assembly [[Candida] jaroonii]|uniref:RNA-binding protein involved in heterochromatin assembly n=1 Tax=[Candida] jaroonii TaxID=467808 RepID=A0ACA9Y5V5_9ASCO|nr:putative RNA-binding protein involved in heterochromatin assembly [[Candida] jaroonii]
MSEIYVVVDINTTCDDTNTYVTKDSTEIIEFSWSIIDSKTLEIINETKNLVKPVNTPITSYCNQITGITWDRVKDSKLLKDIVTDFEKAIKEHVGAKEFSLVSMEANDLKVQLPRESRDKGIILPPFLQHPRIFDFRSEFNKWQINHPEYLNYNGNLNGILVALELVKSEDDKSDKELPTKIEDKGITLYSKLLIQLIKKSPLESDSNVLTKPYDVAQDIKIFLNERSKIIYLTNLPFDTTQSELESWFTQFGARPIAFWTLKNLDNSNLKFKVKGISGFAVFSSHEEARDSLSLNGRGLNDRVIEIQPSSTRILDKANDLLTAFPPSKNRPRPGDWTCPSCGFSNFQRRTACFRCSFPATSAVTFQEQIHPSNLINRNNISPDGGDKLNNIKTTSNINNVNSNNVNGINGNGNGNNNGYTTYDRNFQNNNSSVPFRAGDWKCTNELCQYHNFAKNLVCLKCGNGKPINLHNNKVNQHSVNSAAAAIAAATASGQPLNLNMYQNQMSMNQNQNYNGNNSGNLNGNINGNVNARNFKPSMHMYSGNLSRTNSNPQSQLLNQQYLMMNSNSPSPSINLNVQGEISQVPSNNSSIGSSQSQPQQPQSISPPTTATRSNYSSNSPGLYQAFGNYQYSNQPLNSNNDYLTNQFSSLNLNNN